MCRFFFLFMVFPFLGDSQIAFSEQNIDLGAIKEAYEIKGDVVISNSSDKKVFLMRADADPGVKVYTSKRTLLKNDTCLLVISFIPEFSGKFKKKIRLVSSDNEKPYELLLSGSIDNVKTNDRMACVYFGKRKNNPAPVKEGTIVINAPEPKRDNSNRMPGSSESPRVTNTPKPVVADPPKKVENPSGFSEAEYKPNNILFLVDISSSMRDSLKLPLMKKAMHKLIDAVRDVDTITFVTYATKVKIVKEAVSGNDKNTLHNLVDSLKAKGMTAGKTAILFSQQLSQKHFIKNGNNQIIIATDGEFKFEQEDYALWKKRQGDKKIILSTVAFGQEKPALKNLKEIAYKGEGSFIQMDPKNGSDEKLLNEIKKRSKKAQ